MNARNLMAAFALAAAVATPMSASAQLFRAFLKSTGSDANNCTLQAPCRLLPAALAAVASGGEVWMLDSANYNTDSVVIDKAVSILAIPGAVGSLVQVGGGVLTVTSPGVFLRNIVVGPLPTSTASAVGAIVVQKGANLVLVDSAVENLPSGAIFVQGGSLEVVRSVIRDNGGAAVVAVQASTAIISSSKIVGNKDGLRAVAQTPALDAPTKMSVSDSLISNSNTCVEADGGGTPGDPAVVTIVRTTIVGCNVALESTAASGASTIAVSDSMITRSQLAWSLQGGGVLQSHGGNNFTENGGTTGTLTSAGPD